VELENGVAKKNLAIHGRVQETARKATRCGPAIGEKRPWNRTPSILHRSARVEIPKQIDSLIEARLISFSLKIRADRETPIPKFHASRKFY